MTQKLQQLIREADALSPDEQKLLLAHLATQRNGNGSPAATPLRWSELRGRAPGLTGTDAQTCVSASRRDD